MTEREMTAGRATLRHEVCWEGLGPLSGTWQQVRLMPAQAGEGIRICWAMLPGQPMTRVGHGSTRNRLRCTVIEGPRIGFWQRPRLRVVEHLFFALAASGVTDVTLQVTGSDVPLGNGAADQLLSRLVAARQVLDGPALPRLRDTMVACKLGHDMCATAMPVEDGEEPTFCCELDLRAWRGGWKGVPVQRICVPQSRLGEVAAAKTFALHWQGRAAFRLGLVKQDPCTMALQYDWRGRLVNPELRQFADEEVRHKVLDMVGDLTAHLGFLPRAHVWARNPRHALNALLATALRRTLEQA